MMRLVSGGVEVPARIYRQGELLLAMIRGEPCGVNEVWLRRKRAIDEAEYEFQMSRAEWADAYDAGSARANPRKRVNLMRLKPPF